MFTKCSGQIICGIGLSGLVAMVLHAAYVGQRLDLRSRLLGESADDERIRRRALRWHATMTLLFSILALIGGEVGRPR